MAARVTTFDLVSRLRAEQDGRTGVLPCAGGSIARAVHSGKADTVLGGLGVTDVTGRVAKTLIDLTDEPDAMTHPSGTQIRISRQEISRIVGCSREMVGRVLKQLEEQGMITVSGKTIVVLGTRGSSPSSS